MISIDCEKIWKWIVELIWGKEIECKCECMSCCEKVK